MILLLLTAALASTPVTSGGDLGAWRELQALRPHGDEAVEAYRAFIEEWPASPLADLAWDRLQELGVDVDALVAEEPGLRETVERLERSRAARQQALARAPADVAPAPLAADGTVRAELPKRWTAAMHGGIGWDGADVYGALGVGASRGPMSLLARVGTGQDLHAQAAARLSATPWGPFVEAGAASTGRLDLLGGGRTRLDDRVWLEGAVGLVGGRHLLSPTVRLELVYSMRVTPSDT